MDDRKSWLFGVSALALTLSFGTLSLGQGFFHSALAQESSESSEQGESGEAGESEPKTEDPIALLSEVLGHSWIALDYCRHGEKESAKIHASHPESAMLSQIVQSITMISHSTLIEELDTFRESVETEEPIEKVEAAYNSVEKEVDRLLTAAIPDAKHALLSIVILLRHAGEEYDEGVRDNKIIDREEYADARGFMIAAQSLLDNLSPQIRNSAKQAIAEARESLESLKILWPAYDAETTKGRASSLYAAAAKIEIAANKLR